MPSCVGTNRRVTISVAEITRGRTPGGVRDGLSETRTQTLRTGLTRSARVSSERGRFAGACRMKSPRGPCRGGRSGRDGGPIAPPDRSWSVPAGGCRTENAPERAPRGQGAPLGRPDRQPLDSIGVRSLARALHCHVELVVATAHEQERAAVALLERLLQRFGVLHFMAGDLDAHVARAG